MAETIESKQKYLCQEIMAKGFDPDEFTKWIDENYDTGRKHSLGCDLEKWTQKELEKAVQLYQCSHVAIFAKDMSTPTSPDKSSPTTLSEKAEMSSLRSVSIPVHNKLTQETFFLQQIEDGKRKGAGVHVYVSA